MPSLVQFAVDATLKVESSPSSTRTCRSQGYAYCSSEARMSR